MTDSGQNNEEEWSDDISKLFKLLHQGGDLIDPIKKALVDAILLLMGLLSLLGLLSRALSLLSLLSRAKKAIGLHPKNKILH